MSALGLGGGVGHHHPDARHDGARRVGDGSRHRAADGLAQCGRGRGISSSAVTDRQGGYTIPLLPPGTYQATVEQSGFKKYVHGGMVVQIAQTTRLDIGLQVGAMTEAVEVVGEAPLVRSTTAELGQVIEMKQIQALPLNGRFFQHLITPRRPTTRTSSAPRWEGRSSRTRRSSSATTRACGWTRAAR